MGNLLLLQQFVRAMKAQFLLCWTLLLSVFSANEPQNGPTDHPGLARQWTGQHKGVSVAPNCADTDPNCPDWALAGECTINPRYMLTACRKSCKQCAAPPNFLLTLVREITAIKSLVTKQQSQISHQKTEIAHLQAQLQNLKNQQHEREKIPCECYQHNILDQPSRAASFYATSPDQYRGDKTPGFKYTHSDWKGTGWYRFKGPFTRMAVKSQVIGGYYCSARAPGYLPNEAYDGIEVGSTKEVRIPFNDPLDVSACPVYTHITRCPGNFYVFWLEQDQVGGRGYCGA